MGDGQGFVRIGDRLLGAGKSGDAELVGKRTGGGFVAHVLKQIRRRPDENDPLAGAGAREIGVLREEAISGVDHGHALGLRQFHNALVVEVGTDRPF